MKQRELEDLSPEERAAYAALGTHLLPPPDLEQRLVEELRRRGRLRPTTTSRRPRIRTVVASLAAALILLVLGGIGQKYWLAPSAGPAPEPTFILLLREPRPLEAPANDEAGALMYREYSAWARNQAGAGSLLGGERLGSEGRIVGGLAEVDVTDPATVTGYFLLDVATVAEALRVARTCPHVKYGGVIEIRRIDRL